tara:strand:- start:569 stop:982 length:414 start_codon:yes stop_codon:yes gene_type:complete
MPVLLKAWITREEVKANPHWAYVFGDNVKRQGFGGQAKAMRGEPNSIGVVTKWLPNDEKRSFFNESLQEHDALKTLVDKDLIKIEKLLLVGAVVVIPKDGLGTGLSRLPEFAPKLDLYIKTRINEFVEEYGLHPESE